MKYILHFGGFAVVAIGAWSLPIAEYGLVMLGTAMVGVSGSFR